MTIAQRGAAQNAKATASGRPAKRPRQDDKTIDEVEGSNTKQSSNDFELDQLLREAPPSLEYVRCVLGIFEKELQKKETEIFDSDQEYFLFVECLYVAKALRQAVYAELATASSRVDYYTTATTGSSKTHSGQANGVEAATSDAKRRKADRAELAERFSYLDDFVSKVQKRRQSRLDATVRAGKRLPRVFRLAKSYKLSGPETELLQLLVIFQGAQSDAVRAQLVEDDLSKRMQAFQKLAAISEVDMEEFHDEQRKHIKEGTVLVDEDSYTTSVRLSNITVRVLLGRHLTNNQKLKVSQTELEVLLQEEGILSPHPAGENRHGKRRRAVLPPASLEDAKAVASKVLADIAESKSASLVNDPETKQPSSEEASPSNSATQPTSGEEEDETSISAIIHLHTKKDTKTSSPAADLARAKKVTLDIDEEDSELHSYASDNQLDYLEDRFQVLAYTIRASGARMKDQMKEAGTKQPWDQMNPAATGRRELKAKQRVLERKVMNRLNVTEKSGQSLPRLEIMSRKLGLSSFEQNVIVLLIGNTVSPVVKTLMDGVETSPVQRMDDSITVNQVISVFCDTFQEQIAHRVFFYKSSKLVKRGLVKIQRGRWHQDSGDLVDQRVELDRRILDWVVGLDTEINELVEGSDLYVPKVNIDQVVLPPEQKRLLLESVSSFEKFRQYQKKHNLEEVLAYGSGLVILLCGASGTGKTMTVNAVANYLGKRVLLVDFPSLQGKRREGYDTDADLRGLFREADMSNAVLFFDECESIFRQRETGGDRLLNALLTEMERHEGIVFLATNRPFDLDEAMHRRISTVIEFRPPDHLQRLEIWKVLVGSKIPVDEDIKWESISLKYELSGGFIKNAIVAALLRAIGRDAKNPIVTEEDVIAGCSQQMRGSLQMKTFDHRVVPKAGLDALCLSPAIKKKSNEIVQFEKARGVVYGQWGFTFGDAKQQKGTSVLFYGVSGVGKSTVARAIGFEIGRPLKLVNFGQLIHENTAETTKALRAVFDDARLMDAVLVLEGFEMLASQELEGPGRGQFQLMHLLDRMESFPGVVILIASVPEGTQFQTDLLRRLQFSVHFKMPTMEQRASLWRLMIPSSAPMTKDVNFKALGSRYELSISAISNAVFRAAANAALQMDSSKRRISQKDLEAAAEAERRKNRGEHGDAMDRLFM